MSLSQLTGSAPQVEYALGHSSRELDRLTFQASVFAPFTRHLFTQAGIEPGMRVLDVGSGSGDVSFLAADLVGQGGYVVGVDRSEESPVFRLLAEAVRSLVPTLQKLNIASPAHIQIDSLADRMREQVVARRAVAVSYGLVAAWGRKPVADDFTR